MLSVSPREDEIVKSSSLLKQGRKIQHKGRLQIFGSKIDSESVPGIGKRMMNTQKFAQLAQSLKD